jgi:hypothetical protein
MLIAFGDVGAFDDALCAILHPAIAGYRDFAGGSILSRDELPAGSFAKRTILKRHADSIRLRKRNGKL